MCTVSWIHQDDGYHYCAIAMNYTHGNRLFRQASTRVAT